jgi:hypothetical protein
MGRPLVDGVLLEWGALLFYPYPHAKPGNSGGSARLVKWRHPTAQTIRRRIEATVHRAPQVMVKITGGSRGMVRLRSHLDYITKNGRLPLMDDAGQSHAGRVEVRELAEDWKFSGSLIPELSDRKEALHISLGMAAGTPAEAVIAAAQEFAAEEFADYDYAWVFHGHQKNPHVHLVVKAEGRHFKRLPTRKPDLHRWREGFARALRHHGIEADATRRLVRGVVRDQELLWLVKAREDGRFVDERQHHGKVTIPASAMYQALEAWGHVHNALAASPDAQDRELACEVKAFLARTPMVQRLAGMEKAQQEERAHRQAVSQRPGPELGR